MYPSPRPPNSFPFGNLKFVFYVSESISVLYTDSFVLFFFRFHVCDIVLVFLFLT